MTRETKVGLVVGTGIILLIGIVVSDHLASQQRGQQQTPAPTGYADYATGAPTRTIDPRQQSRPLADQTPATPLAPLPPAGSRTNNIGNGQRTEPIGLNNVAGGTPRRDVRDVQPGAVTDRNLDAALAAGNNTNTTNNNTGNPVPDAARRTPDADLPGTLSTDLRNNGFLPQDNTPRLSNPTGGVTDGGSSSTRPTEPLIHHVQPGESLWAISQKFYGDGKYHTDIARANADRLLADGGIREGVRLVIPNKPILAPGVRGSDNGSGDVRLTLPLDRATVDSGNTTAAAPTIRTVKVEPGDALSSIASRELGSIRHMPLIIAANRDQIDDANDIKAGMTLRIPTLPASPNNGTLNHAAPNRTITQGTTISATVKTYTVQPRDTFSSIARTRLGDERRWKELFELNKNKVRSADALRAGEVLTLPADAR